MIAGVSVPFTEKYVSLEDQIYLTESLLASQVQGMLRKADAHSEYV
jgi:hypothetical protein